MKITKEHIRLVKKYISILACSIVIFLLSACNSTKTEPNTIQKVEKVESEDKITISEEEEKPEEVTETDEFESEFLIGSNDASIIAFETEFFNMIEANPIDEAMKWKDCGSINRISIACDYRDAWIAEIENTLVILKDYLTEADYQLLEESYQGWKQYMENNTSLEQQLFYVGTDYLQAGTGLITGNNDTYPYTMEIAAERTKHYAIQLKSLEYALTGTIKYIYGK